MLGGPREQPASLTDGALASPPMTASTADDNDDRQGRVTQYPFLSDEWLAEARRIRAEFRDRVPEIPVSVRMNQIIQDVPFGDGTIRAHIDTSSGQLEIETGHLESPDLTITIAYQTAKAILVDGDAQAAMQAFLGGRIKVDGDITKMIALQTAGMSGGLDPAAMELARRLQAITA
jgi:SCP-2 sterol transfer family